MREVRALPARERVFLLSLMYHGYRVTKKRSGLKKKKGYICWSTKREDASGIDFWVKEPRCEEMLPIQITRRGDAIFREYHPVYSEQRFNDFIERTESRLRRKRDMCRRNRIAFVLIRDHAKRSVNTALAWGDVKALRYALQRFKR